MAALIDPISGLNYGWALGEGNWNTGMDSNLVQLGATINITVLDFVASPVVTTNGTRYIVTTGSGDFAGQDNKLAARVAGAWVFYTLPEGCIVYDEDTNVHYKFEGGSYVLVVDLSSYLTASAHGLIAGNPHNTSIDDISGLRTAIDSSGSLGIGSTSQSMVFFDDFFNVEDTKSYASASLASDVDEIPVATISAAALNWIGGIRVFSTGIGGYYLANCPNKTATTLFNFLEQNNTIDFATEIYIPTTAEAPATSGNYFVGIVADHPTNIGLTGAVALVVWDVNSANWRLRLANGTFVDTGIAAAKGTKFKIDIKQASDTVLVKINGTTVITATANSISESAVLPCCGFAHAGSTPVTYEIWQDYHGLKLTLNSARANFGFA